MPIWSRMSLIMGQIEPEHPEVFALEFRKIAEPDFVYTVASTNINQLAPYLVKMFVIIRSHMSLIMDLIGVELLELSALELENLPYLTLFTLYHLLIFNNKYQTWPQYICLLGLGSVGLWNKSNQNIQSYLSLNLEKLLNLSVYTLASTNINQSAPNLVKIYVIIRSRIV